MSNERIDLTQFEGIEDRIKHCQECIYPAEDLLQDLALIAPNLIAELKRRYEEIDGLKEHLFAAEKVVMDDSYTFYYSLEELNASD